MKFKIVIQPSALRMLQHITDVKVRGKIIERIDSLTLEPDKIGKPLLKNLAGYRSVRAVGQRYRIIYSVQRSEHRVSIIAIGIRKEGDKNDIYSLAQKLVRLGLTN